MKDYLVLTLPLMYLDHPDKEFRLFTSEVAGVLTQFDPKEIGIMQFDSTHLGDRHCTFSRRLPKKLNT